MILMTVEISHKHDTGFVEAGGAPENMPGERHGRRQNVVKVISVTGRQLAQCRGGGRRNGVEYAK